MNINSNIFVPFGQPTPISYFHITAEASRSLEDELRANKSETITIETKPSRTHSFGRRETFAETK